MIAPIVDVGTFANLHFVLFADQAPTERAILTVVDLSLEPTVGNAMTTLQTALEHVEVRTRPLRRSKIGQELRRTLAELPSQPGLVLLVLGDSSLQALTEARAAISEFDSLPEQKLMVAVAESPASWSALPSIRGYIRAVEGQLGIDATQVALHLASLVAPEAIICVDAEDWCAALGSHRDPSMLAHAYWQEGDDGRKVLIFLTSRERAAVETAWAVAVLPLYPCTRIRQTRDLAEAVASLIPDDATLVMSAPFTLVREHAALNGPHPGVLMICRPSSLVA